MALWITYLTNDEFEGMSLREATTIVNLLDGISAILVVIMAYLSETYLGPYLSLVLTTTAYIFGLFSFNLGGFELVTVVLVGLGRAGRDIQLKEFLADQCRTKEAAEDEKQVESRRKVWWRSAYILGYIIASLVSSFTWTTLDLITSIAMAVAFVLFLLGTAFYERKKPAKTTLKNMLRALYTAITNRRHRHPFDYHRANTQTLSIFNRWFNRADVEESSEGRACTVEQVEVRSLRTMLWIWFPFLVYGLMLATVNTFFYQQTDYTANYLGPISAFSDEQSDYSCNDDRLHISKKVPVIIFVIIRFSMDFVVSCLWDLLSSLHRGDQRISRRNMLVRSGVGLTLSPICCLVAWRIEKYRKHQRMDNGICIRFSWLIPQFVLVGLMEGIVFDGLQNIYTSVVPESLRSYGPSFTQFALNIGSFFSLLFISIFHNLFDDTDLDYSRLGVYYMYLSCVCVANLVFYCCVATYYWKQESCDADEVIELPLEQLLSPDQEGPELVGAARRLVSRSKTI